MKVYRNNRFMVSHISDLPLFYKNGKWTNQYGNKVAFKPQAHTIIYTGPEFEGITDDEHFDGIIEGNEMVISASTYYIYDGRVQYEGNVWIAVWKPATDAEVAKYEAIPIYNIMKGTYSGKDMGERSITAQIDFPSRIDFQIGDYVKFEIANLLRANGVAGGYGLEKFYIYTKPIVKKVASPLSHGKAFQHTVTFYPCQYELATVKMRDVLQEVASGVIYTGYDEFSFYGGANTLMKRIMAVLNERFPGTGIAGRDYWSYQIADGVNEDLNTALEKFQFDFSDSSVVDALLKLNDAEGINTKFFINERMIYVGYKRPYITGVDANNIQRSIPFEFMYGKTSHLPGSTNHGNLFTLTKANGTNSPITRLYAYGSDRNLHRFYCSDRIKTGRYVNKLMLPSFENDGRTDYIDSPEGIAKFGIREGTKTFDNIYPSLRFFYYGNLRDVKYCIKLMGSGLESDSDGVYDGGTSIAKASLTSEQIERAKAEVDRAKYDGITNTAKVIITVGGQDYTLTVAEADQLINKGNVHIGGKSGGVYNYPIARVQCYRVEELTKIVDGETVHTGLNRLVESAPPVDLAVFCHATGKVVKVVLYADKNGQTSIQRQLEADGKIPTRSLNGTDYIVGSCFAVHDGHPTLADKHFECGHTHPALSYPNLPDSNLREAWFTDADTISTDKDGAFYRPYDEYKNAVSIHQIHYTDDHWITDVYEFTDYHQQTFNRQGYSAYCWPRVNKYYPNSQSDNIEVNSVVDVGPVYIEDTDLNISQGQQQQTFDIYLRDVGFKINEQTWFGDRVFLFDTCHINFLDGKLAGYSFEMPSESDQAQLGDIYVPALKPDGSLNSEFFDLADNPTQAHEAYANGAFWRIVAKRQETEVDRYYVPNVMLNASKGDHIVFLDIFMPDIYVRVAEQRLYKEAKKYLDANDDGDIQYSFDIDKVRPNEQPIFAIQMREGAIMRVVDDDLDVGTVNKENMLFDDKDGLVSLESMIRIETDVIIDYEVINRTREDILGASIRGNHIVKDTTNGEWYLFFDTLGQDANKELYYENGIDVYFDYNERPIRFHIDRDEIKTIEHTGSGPTVALHKLRLHNVNFLGIHQNDWLNWDWHVEYSFKQQTLTPQTDQSVLPAGVRKYCAAVNLTEFKPSKYYEVLIDTMEPDLAVKKNGIPSFALVNGLGDGQTIFTPEYTAEIKSEEGSPVMSVLYKFTLSDEFDDSKDYYPAILYQSDGETEAVHVRLWSILERDDEHLGELNYVDLAIDTVTINFNDNTREPGVSLQDGQEPERLTTNQTEMVREVTATVKEESRASAWAQLAQRMDAAEILQDQTLDFYQNLVNQARQHYIQLLNLKNNIFDPDGTCKDTFLQVMMLQVGADSMNYQLKYTHYGMNGQTSNCGVNQETQEMIDPVSGKAYKDSFAIGNAEEVLDHYVYTKEQTGGRWYPIDRNKQFPLHKIAPEGQEQEIYPTYFIALKASKTDSRVCEWVCEPIQHKVNELDDYYYFNWGILVPVSDDPQDPDYGRYQLTETRGNAYMYGDNLICGQISTLAGNSYFDLTHGNFVLSKDGPDNHGQYHEGLTYINGVLTIYGFAKDSDIQNVLTQLGLVDDKADAAALAAQEAAAAASAAQQAANAAQQAVDNVTNDGIISKGTEKQELNREFIIIAGNTRDGESADGSYSKAIAQANQYGVDHTALDLAFQDLYAALKIVLGTGSNGKIDGSNIQNDTYIGGNFTGTYDGQTYDNQPRYDMNLPYGTNLYTNTDPITIGTSSVSTGVTMASGVKYNFFVVSKTGNANPIAVVEDRGYSHTHGTLGGWVSTEKNLSVNGTGAGGACVFYIQGPSSNKVTAKGIAIRTFSDINSAKFNELWKLYYDAEIALLNAIEQAVAASASEQFTNLWPVNEEINLTLADRETYLLGYILADHFNRGDRFTGSIEIKNYNPSEEYGSERGYTYISLRVKYIDGNDEEQTFWYDYDGGEFVTIREDGKYVFSINPESIESDIEIDGDVNVSKITEIMVYIEPHLSESESVSLTLCHGMIVSGNKPGNYSLSYKHLADALQGTTDVVGGLTMTNLMFLKDEDGNVQAGMSGLRDYKIENGVIKNHGVTLFSGGSYEKALAQAEAAALGTLDQLTSLLPVLLTKTGVGSNIGCFRVLSENSVEVVSKYGGRIVIDAGNASQNPSIKFYDKDGECLIDINGNPLPTLNVDSKQIDQYSWDIARNFENGLVIGTIDLSIAASYGVTYNGANNIKIAGFSMGLYAASGVKATGYDIYFDIYLGEKRIATCSQYNTTTVFSDGSMYVNLYISISKFYSISQGVYNITVRNLRARMINYKGNWQNAGYTRIDGLYFGNGLSNSAWTNGNILFSSQSDNNIIIGKNGLLITSASGGVTEFRNRESSNYVRLVGLPNTATDNGQMYRKSDGSLAIKV